MDFHAPQFKEKKLTRSRTDKIVAGVCGGLGLYYGIKPVMIRLFFIVFTFLDGRVGLIIYLVLVLLLPLESGAPTVIDYKRKIKEFIREVRGESQSVAEKLKTGRGLLRDNSDIFRVMLLVFSVIVLINLVTRPFWFSYQTFHFITIGALVLLVMVVIKK